MSQSLEAALDRWLMAVGNSDEPVRKAAGHATEAVCGSFALGPPVPESTLTNWETTHGYLLPFGLKQWLMISDGLLVDEVRWIHPLRCIGPTVRFSPGSVLLQQPASWYEFGNPFDSPVNMDLVVDQNGFDGKTPIFASVSEADDSFRVIAGNFTQWFLRVIESGFRPFWNFDRDGERVDPVDLHYASLQPPKLPPKLCLLCVSVGDQLRSGIDERELMKRHDLNRSELEMIISAYQYRRRKSMSR
ncbi:hypothetical protein GC170_13135 [bacterium]|nr:hypothetical protein [bacterium]